MKFAIAALILSSYLVAACRNPTSSVDVSSDDVASESVVSDPAANDTESANNSRPVLDVGTVQADPALNIHSAPGTNTPVIYAAPDGTSLNILGETAMGDSIWYEVQATAPNLPKDIGWAFGNYIVFSNGSTGGGGDVPPEGPADSDLAYREGYQSGYRDGQNFQEYNSGYEPDAALQSGSGNPDPVYDQAFRDGFYAGFDAGYYGQAYDDTPGASDSGGGSGSNFEDLAMTCVGTFSNGSDFSVDYTREAGFSRITLTTPTGESVSSSLMYAGQTDAQYGVWEGGFGDNPVRLVHLSSAGARPGDELDVSTDEFSGRATCR